MKYREILMSQFNEAPLFTKEALLKSIEKFNVKKNTINLYVSKSIKKGDIFDLKRGVYVSSNFFKANKGNLGYNFFVANNLLTPSYISLDSALQYYGLLAEAVNTMRTSITIKTPRHFTNRLGCFDYRSIKPELFDGFKIIEDSGFKFLVAEPYKAIFDYLYFRTKQFTSNFNKDILNGLRIDTDELDIKQKKKFVSFVKKFTNKKIDL